jgi:hypothetical protein
MSSHEKKTKFSRVLEAEILYLQAEFEKWSVSEPDGPEDCPTDSQLTEHDAEMDEWDKAVRARNLCVCVRHVVSRPIFYSSNCCLPRPPSCLASRGKGGK